MLSWPSWAGQRYWLDALKATGGAPRRYFYYVYILGEISGGMREQPVLQADVTWGTRSEIKLNQVVFLFVLTTRMAQKHWRSGEHPAGCLVL